MMGAAARLRVVKTIHTLAWAVFASAILAIPAVVLTGHRALGLLLVALVTLECLVLALNGMRCPLTNIAARYTEDRRDNFDIYLPMWLARHNKMIFGILFAGDLLLVLIDQTGRLNGASFDFVRP